MNMKLFVVFVMFLVALLNVYDGYLTEKVVKEGIAVEVNPIANCLLNNNILFAVKLLISIVVVTLAFTVSKSSQYIMKASSIIFFSIFVFQVYFLFVFPFIQFFNF